MTTPEFYLDEVAKEFGYSNFESVKHAVYVGSPFVKGELHDIIKEAMLRHSKEACEEQKKLCADAAYANVEYDDFDGTYDAVVSKQSILNAKSPIE